MEMEVSPGFAFFLMLVALVFGIVYGYGLGHYHATLEWLRRTK